MIQLALLRHAKSSWDQPTLDDFDRPLNERGRRAAPVMGQLLASLKFTPDVVLCSSAERTRQTYEAIAADIAGQSTDVRFDDQLYLATPDTMLARLRDTAGNSKRVLLIGHNPGLHALAGALAVTGDPAQLARMRDHFPTAALAIISFDTDSFTKIPTSGGYLEAFITPKDRM